MKYRIIIISLTILASISLGGFILPSYGYQSLKIQKIDVEKKLAESERAFAIAVKTAENQMRNASVNNQLTQVGSANIQSRLREVEQKLKTLQIQYDGVKRKLRETEESLNQAVKAAEQQMKDAALNAQMLQGEFQKVQSKLVETENKLKKCSNEK
jgi:prophage DNA circulation protein